MKDLVAIQGLRSGPRCDRPDTSKELDFRYNLWPVLHSGSGFGATSTVASRMTPPPVVLSIAGFDPSGGAGVTADLATFAAHGLYGTSAVSVWTAQSTRGVAGTRNADPAFLQQTLEFLTADLPPAGVKIGALGGGETARVVGKFLRELLDGDADKLLIPRVLDPVLLSSSGHWLYRREDLPVLLEEVLPRVSWVTPNWAELGVLTGRSVQSLAEAWDAAATLAGRYTGLNVVVTGGDQAEPVDLLLEADGSREAIPGEHVESTSTHGTGCAFSSALLAGLVLGLPGLEAVRAAKAYVTEGIRRAPGLGSGRGPLDLYWPMRW